MHLITLVVVAFLSLVIPGGSLAQPPAPRTLVAVLAHADDEGPAAPLFARYAREGVQVHLLIATDGGQGTGFAAARGDTSPAEQDLVRIRTDEARCAAQAFGVKPPILLSFPDGRLGDYAGDRALVFRLTQRLAEELQRLHPDVIVTWGPDGGMGHPDHRIVSTIVTQLQRTDAPGVPERSLHVSAGRRDSGDDAAARRAAVARTGGAISDGAGAVRPGRPPGRDTLDGLSQVPVHGRGRATRARRGGEVLERCDSAHSGVPDRTDRRSLSLTRDRRGRADRQADDVRIRGDSL